MSWRKGLTFAEMLMCVAIVTIASVFVLSAIAHVHKEAKERRAAAALYQSDPPVEPEKRSDENWWEEEGRSNNVQR